MAYEWDEAKRLATRAERGVDFADMDRFDWSQAYVTADMRHAYGETRLVAFGPIDNRLYVAVFTVERRAVRIISLRKANRKEIDRYEAEQ